MDTVSKISEIKKELEKQGISMESEGIPFSRVNIVIGKNGAGKSRFLRAINNHYDNKAIMCDFTKLKSRLPAIRETEEFEREVDLLDLLKSHPSIELADLFEEIQYGCFDYLKDLSEKVKRNIKRDKAYAEPAINSLKNTIKEILDYEFEVDGETREIYLKRGDSKKPIREQVELFSPGEIVILYMIIFKSLYENAKKPKKATDHEDYIIILDEPECHLHVDVLRKFIRMLVDTEYFSQIWIATHSLAIIPEFEFDNVVYLSDSIVKQRNGKTYESIKKDILGEDDENKIGGFFSSLPDWMCAEFLAECLEAPETIEEVNKEDPQAIVFHDFLIDLKKRKPSVLDFGGGKERLWKIMEERNAADQFEYAVCDPCLKGAEFENKKYSDIKNIQSTFDCIVAMNVIHEINPSEWPMYFAEFDRCLASNGWLLFVERVPLSKGECPEYSPGYYLLDEESLKCLLNISGNSSGFVKINSKNKHVEGIAVSKALLQEVSNTRVDETISLIREKSKKYIFDTMRKDKDKVNAREYAFYVQQYINAVWYLENGIEENHEVKKTRKKVVQEVLGWRSVYGAEVLYDLFCDEREPFKRFYENVKTKLVSAINDLQYKSNDHEKRAIWVDAFRLGVGDTRREPILPEARKQIGNLFSVEERIIVYGIYSLCLGEREEFNLRIQELFEKYPGETIEAIYSISGQLRSILPVYRKG